MSAIIWDRLEDRVYETGLDRGVLYFPDGGGVAWNGLIAVNENTSNSIESVYFDGVKFNDIVVAGDYSATLRAFTYPDEFLEYEGVVEEQDGLYITDQYQRLFHMSYRTGIGGEEGYKIHLLWNLTAIPSTKSYQTLGLETVPMEFEWTITSVPEPIGKYRPTSHVILDSRKLDPFLLEDIELILYGRNATETEVAAFPTFPSLIGFISYIRKWNRLIITDNGDGTWTATAEVPSYIEMLDSTTFQITTDSAIYLDADTYEISSSEKNEEDI